MRAHDLASRRNSSAPGMSTVSLIVYLVVGSIITLSLGLLISMMINGSREASGERSQTVAVQDALQEIVRAVDESATIFRATETQLGVGRNVTNAASGGIDCLIDQFYVANSGGGTSELRQYQTTLTGACPDVPTWSDVTVAPVSTQSSVMVHNLTPYTLVDDKGLATAQCTATATAEERGEDGYCVPLFRYLDGDGQEFIPSTPPAKNSISVVKIVMSGLFADQPVPVSRSKAVSPNNYVPNNQITDVAAPQCPANLSREISGTNVTLRWAPVPDATQYRIVRTAGGTTSTRATLAVSSLPSTSNPSFTDSIAGLTAVSIVYQVVPMVGGNEVTGCPQTALAVQIQAPTVTVTVTGGTTPEWQGARTGDGTFTTWPTLGASWGTVTGASGYEAEIREMNPSSHTGPLTAWAPFSWNGTASANNLVPGGSGGLSINTNTWNGSRLWSRSFQVRVRAVSETGSSAWTYCYTSPTARTAAGECRTWPGSTFPNTGINGYVLAPAPGVLEVTDVTRSYTSGNAALTWGVSPSWNATQYNRDRTFFRVQRHQQNGVDTAVSYTGGDYSNVFANTTSTSGTSDVNAGDWSNFRMLRCNSVNPYSWTGAIGGAYSGTGLVQCGPSSRVWSALGLPGIPGIDATVNSTADTNTARWGKHSEHTTTDYTAQRINWYDVAQNQGGGTGTSASSGNTTTAVDTVTTVAKDTPWHNNTTATSASHDRREGDFTRYAARSCNTTVNGAPTSGWLAGVTGEAGQGTGVESCSNWSGDTTRYWQTMGEPACTASDTWNSITVRFTGSAIGGLYLSPLNTLTNREVRRYNSTESVGWWRTPATSSPWSRVWDDDEASGNASENTVRPETDYRGEARVVTTNAGTGSSTCATGEVNYPPVPNAPTVQVGQYHWVTSRYMPQISVRWNDSDTPVTTNILYGRMGSGSWYRVVQNGQFAQTTTWGSQVSFAARAAHTARLYSWGYYSSNSDSSYATTTRGSGGGIPCPGPAADWYGASGGTTYWGSSAGPTVANGTYCQYELTLGSGQDVRLEVYYGEQVSTACQYTMVPLAYCDTAALRSEEVERRIDNSSHPRTGDTIARYRFYFGDSTDYERQSGYSTWSDPNVGYNYVPPATRTANWGFPTGWTMGGASAAYPVSAEAASWYTRFLP